MMEENVKMFSWTVFFSLSVGLFLVARHAHAASCANVPEKPRIDRLRSANLVVYGKIVDYLTIPEVNEQNVNDRNTYKVTFDLYCMVKNSYSSSTLGTELQKSQIKFSSTYHIDNSCPRQNEVTTLSLGQGHEGVVSLKYENEEFTVDQINQESGIHIFAQNPNFEPELETWVQNNGYTDISSDTCKPKDSSAPILRTPIIIYTLGALMSFFITYW